jgi:glutathione-specific gamma-glutamylcyclotransferase
MDPAGSCRWHRPKPAIILRGMTSHPHMPLNRETILSGEIHDLIKDHDAPFEFLSDEERSASLQSMFEAGPIRDDVWLFAYGSLIWNPTIEFAEQRCVTVRGYHRKFCLEVHLARGSRRAPGLVLGLDQGGSCRGVAFRIRAERAREELDVVWRREMVSPAYSPRWLHAHDGQATIKAIGFVVNRTHDQYVGNLEEARVAALIARASGFLGSCADYLHQTSDYLLELGIPDSGLLRLEELVRAERRRDVS